MLLVAIAVALRALFFGNLGRSTAYLTFYPAVMVAALYGGLPGGLLATALSAPVCVYWIQKGFMSPVEWLALAVFLMACTMVSSVCEAMLRAQTRAKRAEETLRESNRTLEDQVLERTAELSKTNESLRQEIVQRKQVEEELRGSKVELIEAQRVGGVGNWSLDPKTGAVAWSEALYRIFGRDPGLPPPSFEEHTEILSPESLEKLNPSIEKCMQSGEPYELDLEVVRPDGTRGWIIARGEARRGEDGRIVRLRGTAIDNTERKIMEEQLRKSLNQEFALRRIDEKILSGVDFKEVVGIACDAIVDMGYRMCWIGQAKPDHTVLPVAYRGFNSGYLENIDFRWDDTPEGKGPTGISIRTGQPCIIQNIGESSLYAPWREIAIEHGYLSSASFPLQSGEGEVVGVLHVYGSRAGVFSDEEIGRLETYAQQCTIAFLNSRRLEELRDTTQRLSFHVNRMPLGYIVHDEEFRIVGWNPAAERIFGWSADEAMGKHPFELIVPPEMQAHVSTLWSKLREGYESSGNSAGPGIRKDGTTVNCEWFSTPLRDATGAMTGIVTLVHDITEKTKMEKQLLVAQKMESVGTLAGGIAHDFNNALTGIVGFGELLRMRMAGDEQALHDLDEIQRCAERAATLTRQLLTFARRQVIEPVNFNLNTLVADLMKFIGKVVGEHIEIKTSLAKDLPTIRADRGQIEQVVMNLCLNARDAMPEGGRLVVETEDAVLEEEYVHQNPYMGIGRYALLTVSDTGVGMDEKTRARVFEPFFTTKGPDKGTGLGLAMVYGIVKQHGGFIHLYSEPGKGTAFKVYFAAIEAQPDAVPTKRREEIVRGGTETILLAEDEEAIRALAERILTGYGYTVLVARDGEEAIGMFRQNKEIALAVLDVVMPRKGGKEVFDEMHKQNPRLKVIFMSGYSADGIHDSFVLTPGTPFLQKPFGPTILARKVREVLDTQW
jgi:PAS domain S-box-containing protein